MSENPSTPFPVAGEKALLANRYSGALLALAEQDGVLDAIVKDMENLKKLWDESVEWRAIAQNSRLGVERTAAAVDAVSRIAGLHRLTANLLSTVARNRRLSLLPLLVETFMVEVGKRRGEFLANVMTARPLTDAQRERLSLALAKATGGKIRLRVFEDPSLIAGLTVKIGSEFVDASVKTKLDQMERQLRGKSVAA